jgi:hypothetical protein
MNVGDETKSKYQTSFSGYETLQQAKKELVAGKDVARSVDRKDRDTLLMD